MYVCKRYKKMIKFSPIAVIIEGLGVRSTQLRTIWYLGSIRSILATNISDVLSYPIHL